MSNLIHFIRQLPEDKNFTALSESLVFENTKELLGI